MLDRSDAAVRADPHPLYRTLREEAPVFYSPTLESWVVSRHADVMDVLHDRRWSNDPRNSSAGSMDLNGPLGEFLNGILLFMDPPDHTRLRSLVSKAFTPRVLEQLRGWVESLVDQLLDEAAEKGEIDLMADLAFPLPVAVIAELLGVPVADRDVLRENSRDLIWLIEYDMPPDKLPAAATAALTIATYLLGHIEERRQHPRDDLLSTLVMAEEAGDKLTQQELLTTCILLLIAGHETTMNLIGLGTLALLRHRSQLERVHHDPSLARPMVEELLRFDGPIQLTARSALEDVKIGDALISTGQTAMVLLAAANRDPSVFADPEALDVTREDAHHLAFGHGAHFCLGASLARLEAQAAIGKLVARFPSVELVTEDFPWRETTTIRGMLSLPLSL